MWSMLVWLVLNLVIVIGLPGEHATGVVQSGIEVTRGFISCLIWTAYMVKSQRVAATFVHDVAILRSRRRHRPLGSEIVQPRAGRGI